MENSNKTKKIVCIVIVAIVIIAIVIIGNCAFNISQNDTNNITNAHIVNNEPQDSEDKLPTNAVAIPTGNQVDTTTSLNPTM
jgi:flagellar basal body-associated protein FliL